MKVVIVDKPEVEVSAKKSQLFLGTQGIPLRLVQMLVLGHDVALSSGILLKLSKENIAVLMLSKNNEDIALTLPQFSKNSEVKMAQYAALDKRLGYAKYFVDEKIKRHVAQLKSMSILVEAQVWHGKVQNAQSVEQLLGVEGSFSRVYFGHYFTLFAPHLHKGKRSKRPALDPVNAMLSYMYTIVYNLLTTKLYMAGFEPSISYLHTPFRSHYALSSDFMELYRAQINAKVLAWFHDGVLTTEDFSAKNGVYFRYESRKKLWVEVKELMQDISQDASKEMSLLRTAIV